MNSLSPHGLRTSYQPSRRGFLIAMMGAGVMLGYARSGLTAVEFLGFGKTGIFPRGPQRGEALAIYSNRLFGTASIPAER